MVVLAAIPAIAFEIRRLEIASYFSVGSLSVFVWDLIYNFAHDYDLAKTHGADLASMIYFISRASTFGFVFTITIILTRPLGTLDTCTRYRIANIIFYNLLMASTLLLSYIRVCAVWNRSRPIVLLFGVLWLFALACSLTTIPGIQILKNPQFSDLCFEFIEGNYLAAAVLGPTVNHVLVFCAITYGLCRPRAMNQNFLDFGTGRGGGGYRVYVFGDTLPAFSKALLQSSQLCYAVVVLCGIFGLGWFFGYQSDASYRIAFVPIYATVVNIMFSWVFRKAKLGVFTIIPPPNFNTTDPNDANRTFGRGNGNGNGINIRELSVFPGRKKDLEANDDSASDHVEFKGGDSTPSPSETGHGTVHHTELIQEYVVARGGHHNVVEPVKIGVEQVIELVPDPPPPPSKKRPAGPRSSNRYPYNRNLDV
ncbi:hypothetical protein D9613_009444 [Agrocybe pediades]|uniref:Uncharacterized protein n=1 Tax=Agrocybe pediades TaxID=84607 RepID=A0A8H4VTM7_9AGAR|nr:hypothetical protein D9613_009444 [Agrocybe pediades]